MNVAGGEGCDLGVKQKAQKPGRVQRPSTTEGVKVEEKGRGEMGLGRGKSCLDKR